MSALTISFTYGSDTLVLPTPDFGTTPGQALRQSVGRAMGGRVTAVTWSSGINRNPEYIWNHLPEADALAAVTFFLTTVGGAGNDITLVDWDSNTYTVRYMGGLEEAAPVEYDGWRVKIKLAVVA